MLQVVLDPGRKLRIGEEATPIFNVVHSPHVPPKSALVAMGLDPIFAREWELDGQLLAMSTSGFESAKSLPFTI